MGMLGRLLMWWRPLVLTTTCFVKGHDWKVLKEDPVRRLVGLHLSMQAGQLAVCRRCGQVWDDFHAPGVE